MAAEVFRVVSGADFCRRSPATPIQVRREGCRLRCQFYVSDIDSRPELPTSTSSAEFSRSRQRAHRDAQRGVCVWPSGEEKWYRGRQRSRPASWCVCVVWGTHRAGCARPRRRTRCRSRAPPPATQSAHQWAAVAFRFFVLAAAIFWRLWPSGRGAGSRRHPPSRKRCLHSTNASAACESGTWALLSVGSAGRASLAAACYRATGRVSAVYGSPTNMFRTARRSAAPPSASRAGLLLAFGYE